VNTRAGTASDNRRLVLWGSLVALLIALAYSERAAYGKPDPQVLYEWSTAVGTLIQDAILLALVLLIGGFNRGLLALRRPESLRQAVALIAGGLVLIYVWEIVYSAIAHPGNEQGLTPAHWEPHHAAAYIVNSLVICTWVPLAEELTFRGLGYSLLERFGRWPAILLVGLLFGLFHGLVISLPVLAGFGCVLAWIRSKTQSVFPGMVVHGLFNLIALIVAVTVVH
jgi:membrane protease YdiL (CAAX protease family)